jgi:hypothetical protein
MSKIFKQIQICMYFYLFHYVAQDNLLMPAYAVQVKFEEGRGLTLTVHTPQKHNTDPVFASDRQLFHPEENR